MSMNSKQRWMGGVVLLGGGVLLAALLMKGTQELQHKQAAPLNQTATAQQKNTQKSGDMQALQPLTVDVETEKRLLEEQKRARERAVAEQEAKTQQYLQQQQQAEADAARKAAEEYAEINKRRTGQDSSDNIPPEVKPDGKIVDQQHQVDSDVKKKHADDEAAKHKVAVDAKKKADAEAKRQADLEAKKQADADAKKQADEDARHEAAAKKKAELEAQKKADAEQKRKADAEEKRKADAEAKHKAVVDAKKKAEAEAKKQADADAKKSTSKKQADADKARDLLEGKKKWMVQVSLAANQANADATVAKLRAKGYKVVTSPTSKGIRIMVGPSKDRDGADTARRKIQGDASLGMKSAWVIDWVPLDQR